MPGEAEAMFRADVEQDFEQRTRRVFRRLRDTTPVRTGRLKRGWRVVRLQALTRIFRNRVPYAPYALASQRRLEQFVREESR